MSGCVALALSVCSYFRIRVQRHRLRRQFERPAVCLALFFRPRRALLRRRRLLRLLAGVTATLSLTSHHLTPHPAAVNMLSLLFQSAGGIVCSEAAPFFGFMGVSSALVFASQENKAIQAQRNARHRMQQTQQWMTRHTMRSRRRIRRQQLHHRWRLRRRFPPPPLPSSSILCSHSRQLHAAASIAIQPSCMDVHSHVVNVRVHAPVRNQCNACSAFNATANRSLGRYLFAFRCAAQPGF